MDEKELKKALDAFGTEIDAKLKKATENLNASVSEEEKKNLMADIKKALEPELQKYAEMQKQLDALDTSMKRVTLGKEKEKTFKDLFKEQIDKKRDELKQVKSGKKSVVFEYEMKADDMTQSNSFESTLVVPATHVPGIVYDPNRTWRVRDILAQGTTDANAVNYVQEYAYSDGTKVTTEGLEYGQSDFDLKLVTSNVFKITAYVIISEEMLEDVNGLTSYLMARLPEKLKNEEDDQLLNHTSYGILTLGTAYSDNLADSDISRIDVLVDACRQVIDDEYRPTFILLHPADATLMKLTKDDNGQYIFPWIFQNGNLVIDGVPVIVSTAITSGTFLVGDGRMGAQVFDRRQMAIEFTNTNEDNFVKGMVTVRISERLTQCVYRPKAFIYGTFASALALGSA